MTQDAIDAAAKHLRETMQAGKKLTPWETTPKATKRKWLVLAEGTLRAASALSTLREATEGAPTAWMVRSANYPVEYFSYQDNADIWANTPGVLDAVVTPLFAALRNAEPVAASEPVVWQWRQRTRGGGEWREWSAWHEGRREPIRTATYESEERPLFAATPPVAQTGTVGTTLRPLPAHGEEAEKYCEARGPRWAAAYNALRDYHMSNMADEDGFGGYPFVDLVSRDGDGVSIADGEFEIVCIIDEIMAALFTPSVENKP